MQRRLDEHPEKMRQRREAAEHPFGAIKARMGATQLPDEVAEERAHRDGAQRARLQSDPGHEHHGHRAADRAMRALVPARPTTSLTTLSERSAVLTGPIASRIPAIVQITDPARQTTAQDLPRQTFPHSQDPRLPSVALPGLLGDRLVI